MPKLGRSWPNGDELVSLFRGDYGLQPESGHMGPEANSAYRLFL